MGPRREMVAGGLGAEGGILAENGVDCKIACRPFFAGSLRSRLSDAGFSTESRAAIDVGTLELLRIAPPSAYQQTPQPIYQRASTYLASVPTLPQPTLSRLANRVSTEEPTESVRVRRSGGIAVIGRWGLERGASSGRGGASRADSESVFSSHRQAVCATLQWGRQPVCLS